MGNYYNNFPVTKLRAGLYEAMVKQTMQHGSQTPGHQSGCIKLDAMKILRRNEVSMGSKEDINAYA